MKRIFLLILSIATCLVMLASCLEQKTSEEVPPISLAKTLDEAGYHVKFVIDEKEIKDFANILEIRSKGILYAVAATSHGDYDDGEYNDIGLFFYCDNEEAAERMFGTFEENLKSDNKFIDRIVRCIVERKENIVFIGCEDAWEATQSSDSE